MMKVLAALISIVWASLSCAADTTWRAGYRQIVIGADPAIETSLWYPTEAEEVGWDAGPFRVTATRV